MAREQVNRRCRSVGAIMSGESCPVGCMRASEKRPENGTMELRFSIPGRDGTDPISTRRRTGSTNSIRSPQNRHCVHFVSLCRSDAIRCGNKVRNFGRGSWHACMVVATVFVVLALASVLGEALLDLLQWSNKGRTAARRSHASHAIYPRCVLSATRRFTLRQCRLARQLVLRRLLGIRFATASPSLSMRRGASKGALTLTSLSK